MDIDVGILEKNISDDEAGGIFASFGGAVFLSQSIEHTIVTIMVLLDLVPNQLPNFDDSAPWSAAVDKYVGNAWTKTMGRLIKELKSIYPPDDEIFETLSLCLSRRNFLAHHFVRERAKLMFSPEGRARLITELKGDQELFNRTINLLQARLFPLFESHGITREIMSDEVAEFLNSGACP